MFPSFLRWGISKCLSGLKKKKIHLPIQETQEKQFQSLGQEDPLEDLATFSSILAWRIP